MRIQGGSSKQWQLQELRSLSARLGRNPQLVQASSGNTSIKLDDTLWIKASGKWLVQAEVEDLLVPVQLGRARDCLQENSPLPETVAASYHGLCASIETAMHAVLPFKVVLHVHSVNAIAWALRNDGPEKLAVLLGGLPWQWIPYTPSGPRLARQLQQALYRFPETSILVLGNHGLVVCGDDCQSAERLLDDVERRLAVQPRPVQQSPQLAALEEVLSGTAWRLPACLDVHCLALDNATRRLLSKGVLYPCQAIFLPGTMPRSTGTRGLHLFGSQDSHSGRQVVWQIDGCGVLCSNDLTRAESEMLIGLVNVVQRIDPSASIRYLTDCEIEELFSEGAEAYRKVADPNGHAAAVFR